MIAHGVCSSTANCQTKISAIFRGIFGIFRGNLNFCWYLLHNFSRNPSWVRQDKEYFRGSPDRTVLPSAYASNDHGEVQNPHSPSRFLECLSSIFLCQKHLIAELSLFEDRFLSSDRLPGYHMPL